MSKTVTQVLCPKCKGYLRFVVESEVKTRETIVKYIYVCNVCRYKHVNESVIIKMDGDKLIISKPTSTRYS